MKNVHEILNNVVIDFNEYDESKLNDIEMKKMRKRVKRKIRSRNEKILNKVAVIALLAAGLYFGFNSNILVLADIPIIGSVIEDYVKSNKSLEDYKTIIGKTITDEGISVKLNEVLLDDNRIVLSSTFSSDKVNWENVLHPFPRVYINGKEVIEGGGGLTKKIDDSTYTFFSSIDTNKMELKGDLNIKVVFYDIRVKNGDTLSGKWSFYFSANKDKLIAEVKTIPINRKLTLDSGQEITIESIRISPVSTTLNYTMHNGEKYDTHFIVKDQDGKELQPSSGQTMSEHNFFRYETLDKSIAKLKITPYLTSGYEGEKKTDYHKVLEDEAFEIDIK